MAASNCIPRRLGLCWSCALGLLPVSAATPSMDHEHGTVCQLISEHQIRLCTLSSVISRPTCFCSSLRCCWQVDSAPFVRRHCDCLASLVSSTNIQTYLLTYLYCPIILRLLSIKLFKLRCKLLSLNFSGHFSKWIWLAGFIEAKLIGGDNWSYKSCKAPLKSSPPTN